MFYDFSRTLISSKLVREEEKEHATSGLRVTQLFLGRVTSINSQSETRIRKVFRNAIRAGECKQNISLYIILRAIRRIPSAIEAGFRLPVCRSYLYELTNSASFRKKKNQPRGNSNTSDSVRLLRRNEQRGTRRRLLVDQLDLNTVRASHFY